MCRNSCKECPWVNNNPNSLKFKEFSERSNRKHACHMIEKDVWGLKTEITKDNVCIGFINQMMSNNR
jgi:hypothetical protein